MTRILLDTSSYSAFMSGEEKIKSALQTAEEIYFSPIVVGELLAGFMRGKNEGKNRRELGQFFLSPRVDLLPIDEETSERYALILNSLREKGTPVPTNDLWIAASAMQYGLRVLTTDRHYQRIPQILVEYIDV